MVTQTATGASGAVTDHFDHDSLEILRPRVARVAVHKMQVTATVRLCEPGMARPLRATREFSALPQGLGKLTGWLLGHAVTAAAMGGTGIFWKARCEALEDASLQVELLHSQHLQQIRGLKTDIADGIWLARVCQFGLGRPSFVPSPQFQDLREHCRYRRQVVEKRTRGRNHVHKIIDCAGLRVGGVLSDMFGRNGRMVLDGLAADRGPAEILQGLT